MLSSIVLCIVAALLTAPFSPSTPGPTPGLHFVDVGQGAAVIAVGEEGDLLVVDSGPPGGGEALLAALLDHGADERGVALWAHTHFDTDHIGGLGRALAGADGRAHSADDLSVVQFWDRGLLEPTPQTPALSLYRTLTRDRRSPASPGAHFMAPGLSLTVLELEPPPVDSEENELGLPLCLEVGDLRVLIPGDLSHERGELAAAACGSVDLLWASHHGSADGTSPGLMDLADPRGVVVSAGHENAYCHPSPLALALLSGRPTWILDGAGIAPGPSAQHPCPGMAEVLGEHQRIVGGDLWVAAGPSLRAGRAVDPLDIWLGMPGGGWTRDSR